MISWKIGFVSAFRFRKREKFISENMNKNTTPPQKKQTVCYIKTYG